MRLYFDNCVWQRYKQKNLSEEDMKAIEKLLQLRKQGRILIALGDANEAEFRAISSTMPIKDRDELLKFIEENTNTKLLTSYLEKSETNEKFIDLQGGPKGKWTPSNTAGFSMKETEDLIKKLEEDIKHDDAVHLATACEWGVDIFVTADDELLDALKKAKNKGKDIEGLFSKVRSRYPLEELRNTIGRYLSPNEIETSLRTMKVLSPVDALQEVKIKIENTGVNP